MLKIGATRAHPLRRAKELGAGSGVPKPFDIVYYRDFEDAFDAETLIHQKLAYCRVNESREFFRISVHDAVKAIDGLSNEVSSEGVIGGSARRGTIPSGPPVATPFAELFASFSDSDDPNLTAEERGRCRLLERRLALERVSY